jgi:hypothetical protein
MMSAEIVIKLRPGRIYPIEEKVHPFFFSFHLTLTIKSIMSTGVESDTTTTQIVSCSECQRRKQKCSRLWPCNHCSQRGVSHLCQFGSRRASPTIQSPKELAQSTKKRKGTDPEPSIPGLGQDDFSPADGLRALGYLQIDDDPKFSGFATQKKEPSISPGHEASLRVIPPR